MLKKLQNNRGKEKAQANQVQRHQQKLNGTLKDKTHHQPDLQCTPAANWNATGGRLRENALTAVRSGGGEGAAMLRQGARRTYGTCTNTNIVN